MVESQGQNTYNIYTFHITRTKYPINYKRLLYTYTFTNTGYSYVYVLH